MRFSYLLFPFISLAALPQDPLVMSGDAKFSGTVIEAADRTIIHWSDFSIEAGERLEFIQPHSEAAVLNRVINPIPSRLNGEMISNGRVVLINPAGIIVGKEGRIDMGSFIASSLDIHDRAFLERGEFVAKEVSRGVVVNEGEIRGKEICLVGFEVQNGGLIEGEQVGLVGAREVEIKIGPLAIRTKLGSDGLRAIFEEENLYQYAFNLPKDLDQAEILGVDSLNMPGPTTIERGTLRGQTIYCLGDYIDVKREAEIEAVNGGNVFIGGDLRGQSEDWKGARVVRIDGTIKADGARGGKVIAWSDEAMGFYGSISATGIEEGGFAEVSGKVYLDYKGIADLRADSGKTGMLLMDPSDISINTNADSPGVVVGAMYTIPALASVDLNNDGLAMQLNMSNVTISSNTVAGGTGNITVDAPIGMGVPWTSANTLTLDTTGTGTGSIVINDLISNSVGGGSVVLNSDVDISVLTALGQINLDPTVGSISLNAGRNIVVEGDIISLQTGTGKISVIANGNITAGASIITNDADFLPATPQIVIRADANLDNVGNVQMGTATMAANAAISATDGSVLIEGFNVIVGDPASTVQSAIQAAGIALPRELTVNVRNDLSLVGGGVGGQANLFVTNGNMYVSVHRNASFISGNSTGSLAHIQGGGGIISVAVGNDLLMRSGTADDTDSGVIGLTGLPCDVSVLVGRDLRIETQAGSPTNTENGVGAQNNVMVRVGRNFFAQGGFDPSELTIFIAATAGDFTSIFCGGNMVFQNETTAPLFQFAPLMFHRDSTDLRAGGDIQIGADIDKTGAGGYIYLESDASFSNLWTATPNGVVPTNGDAAILAGTPLASPLAVTSNGMGAVVVNTGALGAATWETTTGNITVLSRDVTTTGASADFVNGSLANQILLSTIDGDVEINGFRNILIDPPIITTGDVFIRAMNDLIVEQPISARNIVLVCDDQAPNGLIGPGSFTLLATGSLSATGTLQIFTSQQGLNSINGTLNLNGLTFAPGTLFVDTDTEHWCVYFGGPGSAFAGPSYTIFYKDCLQQITLQQITEQAGVIVSEFLVDINSYNEFPGWWERFHINYSDAAANPSTIPRQKPLWTESYFITRRYLKAFDLPKNYTALLHSDLDD